jgi:prepilin-type N-terminal cleavage/methylation domain-containing protein
MRENDIIDNKIKRWLNKMKKTARFHGGFSLVEMIITIAIVAACAAIVVPAYIGYIAKSRATADLATLDNLNQATFVYQAEEPSPNPFLVEGTSEETLMQTLVDSGLMESEVEPQQHGYSFAWSIDDGVWLLSASVHILSGDEISMGTGGYTGYITGSYSGEDAAVAIPKTIDGTTVTHIYQDVFSGKGLDSVSFAADGSLTRIHARAFRNNNLTEVTLPDSITKIDYGAFLGNDITKITIGAGVTLEGNVFQNNNNFRDVYYGQGAGTYVYENGDWVKQ